ncbi:hypothetical protein L3X38_009100 [Prunus dulcis]|uniref:Uncharacterized protein n=1 Tax=Prunus dulcis TaxID=3755 RepID=A0AAD4ZXX6_PRUDU|nr:hypothetical protein L3X38_009100 [Prunus dulcis]
MSCSLYVELQPPQQSLLQRWEMQSQVREQAPPLHEPHACSADITSPTDFAIAATKPPSASLATTPLPETLSLPWLESSSAGSDALFRLLPHLPDLLRLFRWL